MPIYEYRCDNGHNFEIMQRMSDDALTECTECGAPVRRVLHSPAIHFKGSGFHNTDYGTRSANKAKQAAAAAAKDSGSDSGSGDSGSSGSNGSFSGSDSASSGSSGESSGSDSKSGSGDKTKSTSSTGSGRSTD